MILYDSIILTSNEKFCWSINLKAKPALKTGDTKEIL